MQKIKYGDTEFLITSIVANDYRGIDTIEITFEKDVDFSTVQQFYDTNLNVDSLRLMEIYTGITTYEPVENEVVDEELQVEEPKVIEVTTWELQGTHIGYTKPMDISCFGGVVKVKIERELEVESKLAELQNNVDDLIISNLESEGIL